MPISHLAKAGATKRELLPQEQILSFKRRSTLRRALSSSSHQSCSPFVKIVENIKVYPLRSTPVSDLNF